MTTAITSGIELDYTITGTGDPIVFIPGISLTQNVWGMSVPAFDGYQCITVDNRDAGPDRESHQITAAARHWRAAASPPQERNDMTTAITSGIELDYTITGTGDPIVFIPGISLTQNVWGMSVPAFDGYQCITLDNRDAGGSPRAAAPYTAADMAQDVIALLERLDAGPAHLVGHSLGGAIAQEVCLAAPARVRSLVLVDTWATNDAYTTGLLELWKLFADQLVVQDDFQRGLLFFGVGSTTIETAGVENLIAGFQAGGPPQPRDAFKRQVDAALGHNTLDRLGEIGCPALLVRGDEDNFFPAKHAGQLRAGIHRSRVETIAGSGHSPLVENPPAFTRAVRRFLQAL